MTYDGEIPLYDLVREFRSIVAHDSARERMLKSASLLEIVIRDYIVKETPDKPGLPPLIQMQAAFLRQDASKLFRACKVRGKALSGKSVSEDEMQRAGNDFQRGVQRYLKQLGERCEVDIDFETGSLAQKSSSAQPDSATRPLDQPPAHPRFEIDAASGPSTQVERQRRPSLDARPHDPDVSASTVAEYAFCPRAGIVTHEADFSDPEQELPSLSSLPWYEQNAIEEAYARSVYKLFSWLVGFVAGLFILSFSLLGHPVFPFAVLALVGICTYFSVLEFGNWRLLGERRLAASLARACDPDAGSQAFQEVDWWGLLLAGFEVRRPETALKDQQWKLSGKPRRILQKGSMTVPVHRINKSDGPLSPQHIARVMAHCHLIEATEGAVCPYAIVLFGNTYQGTTVPNTRGHREQFYTALERVRTMIIESDAGERQPPEPVLATKCSGCPHGKPRPVTLGDATMHYGEPLEPYAFGNRNGKKLHCSCGDRFRWIPPHDRNARFRGPQ